MNKFKKIAIGALIVAGAGCIAGAAGCSNDEPDYFKLVFEGTGLDYVFQGALAPEDGEQFVNGYVVKSGVEVRFTLALSSTSVGTPVISLNGSEIVPDEQGVYSFVIDKDSTVSVSGLEETKKVTFSGGDWHKFYDEQGNEIGDNLSAVKGDKVKFKLWVSPYMKSDYNVTNDTEELEPDADGYYTVDVADDCTVNVNGLEQDESFLERGEGTGTQEDPYIVRRPIDLFTIAAVVNSDFYTGYATAYYRLEEDIDMRGEKLFVIGDMSNASAIFCGSFDGNDHKISNFYITDEVIDQSMFNKEYLPFVGLFGYACATQMSPAIIKDLTLENYNVTVHPELSNSTEASYAGSLVGYGIGVQIENCKMKGGKVVSYNDDNKMSYIGGAVGVLQSAYSEEMGGVLTYDAYVNGCYSDVEVTGRGSIRCAGGIAGILSTADTQAIAYVSNSVAVGRINGAMLSGGIVGSLAMYSSVANCYASGAVRAVNNIVSAGTAVEYRSAYAGGIVGYAENDSVISGCYAANGDKLQAKSATDVMATNAICGKKEEAFTGASDSAACVLNNNLEKQEGHTAETFTSGLKWAADEWDLSGATPVYKGAPVARKVTIKVKDNGGERTYDKDITTPVPIYAWYTGGMDEYVESDKGRSWGYYFDEALTQKVPYGYIPAADVDLYVGFSDYSQVAGTYHVGATTYGLKASLTLDDKGGYVFRDGGMSLVGSYSYDGKSEKITLYNTCFSALEYSAEQTNGSYVTMVMEKKENSDDYELKGKLYVTDSEGASALEELTIIASKQSQAFKYGEYVNSVGTLLLRENGTGIYTVNKTSKQFTFTVNETVNENGKVLKLELSNGLPVTVVDGVVTEFAGVAASFKDGFAGVWKTSAGSSIEYSFDGFGTVKCGNDIGAYKIDENDDKKAVIELGGKTIVAEFKDGVLNIDGIAHYISDGFAGNWYGRSSVGKETVELRLGGIGKNGYGEAEMTFSSGVTFSVNGQYSVTDDGVMVLYVGDTLYGELTINKETGTASGPFFSYTVFSTLNQITYANVEFNLYDLFKGVWVCDVEGASTINFTGKANGNQGAKALVADANGTVTTVEYTLDSTTTGKITIGGKTYAMSLDEAAGRVSLTDGQTVAGGLAHRDAWYGVTLHNDKKSYKFDGSGNLTGKVTVSDGQTVNYLNYTIGENGLPVVDGVQLVEAANGFDWGGVTLAFETGFANTWLMPVTNEEITISEVAAELTAQVSYGGNTYEYKYNPERNNLAYTDEANGVTTVLSMAGSEELALSRKGKTNEDYICIASDKSDGWTGKYTAADKSTWVFDGHGSSKYGSGSAIYTDANGKKTEYTYVVNELGLIYIRTGTNTGMVFKQVSEGGYSLAGADKAYAPVQADIMYLAKVRLNNEFLTYDGVGGLWNSQGVKTAYGYMPLTAKCCVIITESGKKFGDIKVNGGVSDMTLRDYAEWTLASDPAKKYVLDTPEPEDKDVLWKGGMWLIDGENFVREYYFESSREYEGVLYLTAMDEKEYKITLNRTNNTFVLEEIKNED